MTTTEVSSPRPALSLEEQLAAAQAEGLEPNLRRMLRFVAMGGPVEFQALGVRRHAGDSFERVRAAHALTTRDAIRLCAEADESIAQGVYVLPARLCEGAETRHHAPGAWYDLPKRGGTTVFDVARRHVLAVDFDVLRPSNTSATDEEVSRSIAVARVAWPALAAMTETASLALVHSGNGRQIWIALDGLGADDATKLLCASVLAGADCVFSTAAVKVDLKLFDAKRILPACGTMKRKGAAAIVARPHRRTAIVTPDEPRRLSLADLREFHARLRDECDEAGRAAMDLALGIKPSAKTTGALNGSSRSARPFDQANDLDPTKVAEWLELYESGDLRCPGCGESSGVDVLDHGLKCLHNRCANKGRGGFRTNVDLTMEVRALDKHAAVAALVERFGLEPLREPTNGQNGRHDRAASDECDESAPAKEGTREKPVDLVGGFPLTDSGNAERLIALHGQDLRFVRTWDKWLGWNGKQWALDSGAPHRAAKSMARALMKQAEKLSDTDKRSAAIKYSLKCEGKSAIEAMVSLARHELAIAITHEDLDTDPWLFCVRNGTIELKTGTLRAHRRADLITKSVPIDYSESATCERFERFVSEVMANDAELVTFLQRFLGYALTGDVREHILTFWHGEGGNGKSLLAGILLHVFGDYACKAAPDLLFKNEHTERHPTELCDLHGRRLVVCNETTRGRAWDESTLKDTTGGDRLRGRRMRQDFWEWSPTHKLVVFGQHKPRIRQANDAIRRRLRLVPFAVSFIGREDRTLAKALEAEAPGVLRWLVAGCVAWQRDGLPEAKAVSEATGAYFRDEDVLGQFLDTECVFADDAKAARKEVRERYAKWSAERDERPVGPKALAEAIRRRGAIERKVHTAAGKRDGWAGLRLATEADRAASETAPGSEVVTGSEQIPVQQDLRVPRDAIGDLVTTGHYLTTRARDDSADYLEREGIEEHA
ncbi:MAG: phage/plasmid primase, P4 family [Myxococcota bacterium]|nr:phage/plasmid primase, P4 family [Myxococcota bacterium]